MFKISKLPLKAKLPLVMVALTGTFLITVAFLVYTVAEKSIRKNVYAAHEIEAKAGAQALEFLISSAQSNLANQAAQPTVFRAISNFSRVIGMIEEDDPIAYLKRTFAQENPHPVDQRDQLTDPGDETYYTQSHVSYHPTFQRAVELNGYEDLYLFDAEGLLIYSVKKQDDFANSFADGELAATSLGQLLAEAMAAEAGQVVLSDFSIYGPAGGAPSAFFATPVLNKRKQVVGVIAARLGTAGVLQALTKNLEDSSHQNIYLVSGDGLARSPSSIGGHFNVLDRLPEVPQTLAARNREGGHLDGVAALAGGQEATALVMPLNLPGFDWTLVLETDSSTAFAGLHQIRMIAFGLIAGAVAIAILVSLLAARRVTTPIQALREVTNALAENDYEVAITGKSRGDELGDLARSLDSFRDKLKQADEAAEREIQAARQTNAVVEEMSGALAQLQSGNLACDIEQPFADHYETLRENFNHSLVNLRNSMGEVIGASEHVGRFSDEQKSAADEMAHRTESQANTLEETVNALRDLTTGIRATADSAARMDSVMRQTRDEAEGNTEVVETAVGAMDQIQETSSEISKIINLIDDIAFQTNLLALNAGVEAARAGSAGAGFAVVASEVRALAQRTSTAAGQIQELTSASENHVAHGVSMVGKAGDALSSIISQVSEVSGLVSEIANGVQKQSGGLENINTALGALDSVTQRNAAMAEEASASSQMLQHEAQTLSGIVSRFQLGGGTTAVESEEWESESEDWSKEAYL
ncbi:methyl-accepting chemotaxis protein McpC [Roseobacter sp. SK209-2-6]|uniref:methyl-accepting chemotaxis protein n=1 Tax=Roseobacter sp. SK209-2-6 TaxID=388739 RepID=UPI0000F3CED4|nr:methyl-accepting chemotaxis protein [Roseobacter sp. SK209-2-6]EBA15993.1 methyl-accepting chemotaxis protein McpC [Roseobacter sp. SK209-2-6]